jgi:GTP-binding protein
MSFTVAIVGRPNVGKSTLFNRLVGAGRALVDPTPGVTRDRLSGAARLGHLAFTAIDTAGLDEGSPESLEGRLRQQTATALAEADVALMLVDAKSGLTSLDRHFARWLRRADTPVILVANKCEGMAAESLASEAWGLGLGAPVPISAQNGEGLAGLAEALLAYAPAAAAEDAGEAVDGPPLRMAIVGRPNVGKSSLINRLIEDERLLTGPEPGLTRDAVTVAWQWQGRRIELVDTAGLRRRARIEPGALEQLSSRSALAALRQAEVVVLLVDASAPLEQQDVTIANRAAEAGRALVVAANKWDLVEEPQAAIAVLRERLEGRLPHLKGVACLPISVRTGHNLERLLPLVVATHERWSRRIATAPLNRWLAEATAAHPPPMAKGRRVKIRYIAQVSTRPPTFVLFVSQAGALPDSYLRYLTNSLREAFELPGVPLRLRLRAGNNPYV